jgi:platelet-activating factor acetylhydrolase IB subunit alpha
MQVWDLESGEYERTLRGHTNAIQCLAFNLTGTLLASCSSDLSIKLWDFSSGGTFECGRTVRGHDHNISGVVFMPSGDHLISCSR